MSCDGNYAMQLATALRSIVEANCRAWPVEAYILYDDFAQNIQARVVGSLPAGSASIHWVTMDLAPFQEFSGYKGFSKIFYSRLLIPRMFPAAIARVLYLDTDILVLDDLEPLCQMDLEGALLGAALDGLSTKVGIGDRASEGLPQVQDYFNSGVLLMDLNQWRTEGIAEKALEYLSTNGKSRFPDQNALNVVCEGRWKQMDRRWNYQDHYQTRVSSLPPDQRPAIVHFVTDGKPWKANALSVNARLYDSFRTRTRFAKSNSERVVDMLVRSWSGIKRAVRLCFSIRTLQNRIHSSRQ